MAYDEGLAERIRAIVADRSDITEKQMFGGLCLLSHGNMFAGVMGDLLMARVGPDAHDDAVSRPYARVMDFAKRPMRGFVYVDPPGTATDAELQGWVGLSLAFVDTLPAK